MDFDTAMAADVTRNEAIAELAAHGIVADYEGNELFDCATGETIARCNADGEFSGGAILAYLGY